MLKELDRSADEWAADAADLFKSYPRASYVFYFRDAQGKEASAVGPGLSSGVELVQCARTGKGYDGPYARGDADQGPVQEPPATKDAADIEHFVQRLKHLDRRSFILCWNAPGERRVELDYSPWMSREPDVWTELVALLQGELDQLLS